MLSYVTTKNLRFTTRARRPYLQPGTTSASPCDKVTLTTQVSEESFLFLGAGKMLTWPGKPDNRKRRTRTITKYSNLPGACAKLLFPSFSLSVAAHLPVHLRCELRCFCLRHQRRQSRADKTCRTPKTDVLVSPSGAFSVERSEGLPKVRVRTPEPVPARRGGNSVAAADAV